MGNPGSIVSHGLSILSKEFAREAVTVHRGRILCLLHCCHASNLLFLTVLRRVRLIFDFGFLSGAGGCPWSRRPPRFGLGRLCADGRFY